MAATPLSSITLAHAQDYQLFLQNIPQSWINPRPIERANPSWRPFRGQLAPKNQNYTLGVLKQFFRKLIENGYLTSSPFASIQKTAAVTTGFSIDTSRAFNKAEMDLIKKALSRMPGLNSTDPLDAAKSRRTQLVMELALTTGMRRSELCTASLKNLTRTQVNGLN
ncbi:MAG: integrase, partial [Burkholderiales bacterium PBB4]